MDDVKVSDLILTDEHEVVEMDASIADAAGKLLALERGILIVLGEDKKVKGIVTPNQVLSAISDGGDAIDMTGLYAFGYENNGFMLLSPMALIVVGIIIWIQRSRNTSLIEDE
jgi:hypothetical protein